MVKTRRRLSRPAKRTKMAKAKKKYYQLQRLKKMLKMFNGTAEKAFNQITIKEELLELSGISGTVGEMNNPEIERFIKYEIPIKEELPELCESSDNGEMNRPEIEFINCEAEDNSETPLTLV